nr:MAG TPA: hypothetical protein [Caudoviricetes sp.]
MRRSGGSAYRALYRAISVLADLILTAITCKHTRPRI